MSAFIESPTRIPLFLKAGILLAEKITGKPMLPASLLAWYPKVALTAAQVNYWASMAPSYHEKRR